LARGEAGDIWGVDDVLEAVSRFFTWAWASPGGDDERGTVGSGDDGDDG
jgi:hypothetical protein